MRVLCDPGVSRRTMYRILRVLGSRQFAMLTLGMSLPLLFSFQLKTPPAVLQGLPFTLIWTWAVVSAITVPVLMGLEIIVCVFQLRRRNQGEAKAALLFHATALVVSEKKRSLMEANGSIEISRGGAKT